MIEERVLFLIQSPDKEEFYFACLYMCMSAIC